MSFTPFLLKDDAVLCVLDAVARHEELGDVVLKLSRVEGCFGVVLYLCFGEGNLQQLAHK